jgi:hypothetical protein
VNDLDDARELLRTMAGRYAVLGKLAAGNISAADLPALEAAADELGLGVLAHALRRLGRGESPLMVLSYLVGSGEFPDLVDRLQGLRELADVAAGAARGMGYGRR